MQRMTTLVVSVLALSALLGGTAMATENQPPLADAGLDQSVERATTVQLDANGSRDPDGTVEGFEWTIEAPDGTTRTPDCPTCAKTTFTPSETGQYNVTVTVTDDDGASRSDTLHVDVVAAGGPSVSVSAPSAVPVGLQRNLTANVTAGDADLRTLAWVVNGTARNQTRLAGENGTSTITHTFNESGSVSVRAVAYDAAGQRGVANQTIRVAGSSGTGGSPGGNDCPGGSGAYYVDGENKGCTSAAMKIGDTFVDTDGRPGLWTYVDNELTQIIEPEDMNRLSSDGKGGTFTEETINEESDDVKRERQLQDDGGDGGGGDDDSYDETDSTDSNSNTDGNTRPDSSVPGNIMNPDDDTGEDEDGGGYDWDYNDDDDDSSSSESSSDDDGGSDDSSSDDDDDDGGGWFGGGGDDDDSSSDDDGGGGGWLGGFW
ncbi:PKD domain-containing protein [Haloarcula rubripromontorii]|uniref:PKD domain-containing protein n=1 Tax=Haloarcula rubripromontorii TaxID=1705562 RepID=A0A847TY57_9EURY|nr:PKD domain-containing protein [Haloarcula rubripromontorii]NLV05486.1 PKD domain-containing protein [Haloarcula rubripromontorii]